MKYNDIKTPAKKLLEGLEVNFENMNVTDEVELGAQVDYNTFTENLRELWQYTLENCPKEDEDFVNAKFITIFTSGYRLLRSTGDLIDIIEADDENEEQYND